MAELNRLADGRETVMFKDTFPKDRLGQVLSEIDVLVIPSRWYENSPLVLLYALATRTPVIVTDMKGMSEFVKDGHNGFTFKKDDAGQLGRIMQRMVDQPEMLLQLSENADYTLDVMGHVKKVFDIYRTVLVDIGNG